MENRATRKVSIVRRGANPETPPGREGYLQALQDADKKYKEDVQAIQTDYTTDALILMKNYMDDFVARHAVEAVVLPTDEKIQ